MLDGVTPEEYAKFLAPLESRRAETLVPNIIACAIICGVASTFIIGLRALARYYSGIPWARHDYLAFAGWFFLISQSVLMLVGIRFGTGRHVNMIKNDSYLIVLKLLGLFTEVCFFLSLGPIKLSITSLYTAIFPHPKLRWVCWAVNVIVIGWIISGLVSLVLMCDPRQGNLDAINNTGKTCISYDMALLVASSFNIVTDVILLLAPVPIILKLNFSSSKKKFVIVLFGCGGLACIASGIRMFFVIQTPMPYDATYTMIHYLQSSSSELIISLLCACLPTYGPLASRRLHRHHHAHPTSESPNGLKPHRTAALYRNDVASDARSVRIMSTQGEEYRQPGISVTKDIDMTTFSKNGSSGVRRLHEDETRLTGRGSIESHSFETLPVR